MSTLPSASFYPSGTVTLHLTPARRCLLTNSLQLVAVISAPKPLPSALLWTAITALWLTATPAFSKTGDSDTVEEIALSQEKDAEPAAGRAEGEGAVRLEEGWVHVAGLVMGTGTLVASIVKGYQMWQDW